MEDPAVITYPCYQNMQGKLAWRIQVNLTSVGFDFSISQLAEGKLVCCSIAITISKLVPDEDSLAVFFCGP